MQCWTYSFMCNGVTVVLISTNYCYFHTSSLFLSVIVQVPQEDLTDNTLKGGKVDGIGCVGYIGVQGIGLYVYQEITY